MIQVRLFGGLGNQLFQYAAGRALALRVGTELALDLRALDGWVSHAVYGLEAFAIKARVSGVALPPVRGGLAYALWRAGLTKGPRLLREARSGFDARVLAAPDDSYLHGYFQSEAYFADQAAPLREELRHRSAAKGEGAVWLARIRQDGRAVSLHVRRGDYLAEADRQGICDAGYYARALQAVADAAGITPRVYVFSDDPVWAARNLSFGLETHVVSQGGSEDPAEDLRLMSACRHHIIANSTFSWWGAWLNPAAEKVVVAPARWTQRDGAVERGICPAGWLRV